MSSHLSSTQLHGGKKLYLQMIEYKYLLMCFLKAVEPENVEARIRKLKFLLMSLLLLYTREHHRNVKMFEYQDAFSQMLIFMNKICL